MKLSLITPTEAREDHLKNLYNSLLMQNYKGEWEWLIYDTYYRSSEFFTELKDPRVRYFFSQEVLSIGEKRNRLVQKASGEGIVHVDDDDYYSPSYLSTISKELSKCDFFHFHSWFCYDYFGRHLYYVSSEKKEKHSFWLHPTNPGGSKEFPLEGNEEKLNSLFETIKCGYGFCYAYKKEVGLKCLFPRISYGEDLAFFRRVKKKGYAISLTPDTKGEVLHILHDTNTSGVFPQYRLPPFLLRHFFPSISTYLASYPN